MTPGTAEFLHDNLRVLGYSFAGEETYIILPELNLAFDFGRTPRELIPIEHVFLTHGHIDHFVGIPYYFAQRWFLDAAPGNVYVTPSLVEPVQRLLRVCGEIDGHEPPARIHAVTPDVDVPLRRDLLVRPFEVNHFGPRTQRAARAQALGFTVIEVRNKLLAEYQGLTGPQIVELKKQGVSVTQRTELPLISFCGDTGPGPFLDLPHVRDSRILLLECTFFSADDLRRARAGGHIHVSDLKSMLPRLNNERIVLTHTSRRIMLSDAKTALTQELGSDVGERVSFLMEHRRRRGR